MSTADHWECLARHSPLGILLDLDGTLIPFADRPEDARPGPAHLDLLRDLARAPGVSVAIVSGRPRESLESLFVEVPGLWLVAEHGGWLRGDGAWQSAAPAGAAAGQGLDALATALEEVAAQYDGAWVERKTWSACLHYRGVRAREKMGLVVQASAALDARTRIRPGYEKIEGVEALEVRPAGIRKSAAIPWMREKVGPAARLLALGDDLTDEDMFRALGAGDEPIQVGRDVWRATSARWRLPGPHATVILLRWILAARAEEKTPPPELLPSPVVARPARAASPSPHRLLAISNRLPELRAPQDEPGAPAGARKRGVGGLVSALEPILAARGGLWLGWSGRTIPGDDPGPPVVDEGVSPPLAWVDFPEDWTAKLLQRLLQPRRSGRSCTRSRPASGSPTRTGRAYQAVNEAFAAVATRLVDPDVDVWVHDYHLLLVAGALRRRGHRGPIGLLPPHALPRARHLLDLPWAADPARRDARLRPHRLPHARRRRQLPPLCGRALPRASPATT